MRAFQLFRLLTGVCVVACITISAFHYFDVIAAKWFAILSGVLAVLATTFASLMSKPQEPQDLAIAADKLLLKYDTDTLQALKDAKHEEQTLRHFIDVKSNEIFYVRLRGYLLAELEKKYQGSEIAGLINEIDKVEFELDRLNVQYDELNLPERFRRFLTHMERERAVDLMLEMVDAMPFFPFKKLIKVYLKLRYMGDVQVPGPLS